MRNHAGLPARLLVFTLGLAAAVLVAIALAAVEQPREPFDLGQEFLAEGRPGDAAYLFDDPLWQGIAHYRAGRFQRAGSSFAQTPTITGAYNLGVAYARQHLWQAAIIAFEEVLRLEPSHEDARHNLAVVRQAMALEDDLVDRARGDDSEAGRREELIADPLAELDESLESEPGETGDGGASSLEAADTPPGVDGSGGARENAGRPSAEIIAQAAAAAAAAPDDVERALDPDMVGAGGYRVGWTAGDATAEALFRGITDDPARVLRSRLRAAAQNRRAGPSGEPP